MRVARLDPLVRAIRAWRCPAAWGTVFAWHSSATRHGVQALVAALLLSASAVVPAPAVAASTWSRNLYVSSAFVYQDPYYTACTAAATMTMLNIVAARGTGGQGFSWTPYRVKNNADPADKRDMTSILSFARANDTLRSTSAGSDAHGWRNALNYYGWGSTAMADPDRMVYMDRAYRKLGAALRAAVKAVARLNMPVGILGWAGGHAQIMTGYVVTGSNPAVSSDFTIRYVYLSDPLRSDRVVNRRLSVEQLREGALKYRFQRYREADSPYDDPFTAGTLRSSVTATRGASEWYRRWVIVAPVRTGTGDPAPDPTPPPEGSPSPSPSASPPADARPTPTPTPAVMPPPTEDPSTSASPGTQAAESSPSSAATPSPTPTPDAASSPTPTPTPAVTSTPSPTAPATPGPTETPSPDPTPAATPSPAPG